jgi:transcription antitermination factor NusG
VRKGEALYYNEFLIFLFDNYDLKMSEQVQIEKNWYVAITRPRWEKKIAALLRDRDIENYCPINKVRRRWKDRYSVVMEPLFRGYLFIKITEADLWLVKDTHGILNYVYHEKKPAKVRDEEIVTIQKFLNEFEEVEVLYSDFDIGQTVRVNSGIMMDYKGIIIDISGNKAKVFIQSMNLHLSAVFEKSQLSLTD